MDDTLEKMAAELEASGDYKLQRRLRARSLPSSNDGSPTRRAIFLDVETTGLDPSSDEVIEIAMVPFLFTHDGRVVEVLPAYDQLRQPAKPIPPFVTKLTGITDAMVAGQAIDADAIAAIIAPAELIVAHNSGFDRPFAEQLHPEFAKVRWGCSMTQAPWADAGFEGTKLSYLLATAGLFHDGHRACDDCHAAIEMLARPLGQTGRTALAHVLEAARLTTHRIWAQGAPFETKDRLRTRGYRWSPGRDDKIRAWYIDVEETVREAEIAFLRSEIFDADWLPTVTPITPYDRFSDRI